MSADGPIHMKFHVSRVDEAEKDPTSKHFMGCFYWVLDVDHDPYAAAAVRAYAVACRQTHPELASHLLQLLVDRGPKIDTRPHSRACGWQPHEHGSACHENCPTCGGK